MPDTATPIANFLTIRPQQVAKYLLLLVGVFVVLDLGSIYLAYILHSDAPLTLKLLKRFGLNEEGNIPTWFSSMLCFLASVLLVVIAKQPTAHSLTKQWWVLSGVFLFMALDEATSIHEELTYSVNKLFVNRSNLNGYLRYSWVIPYTIALVGLAIFYARFIWQLPPRIRLLFVLAGCIFVSGAVGLEAIEGHYDYLYGMHNLRSALLSTLEEAMEMSGIVLFIYALLLYIANTVGGVQLRVMHEARSR